jgi:hypothetical protein
MATKLSKSDYEFLKQYDPKELDQEQLDAINEYERSEAQAPSKDQLEWATYILNKKGFDQREAISSGDWDKAQGIINQNRAASNLMKQKGQDPYVHQVKEVPDNVPSSYGFKFNWKDQYEKETGEKLRATEADAEKLRKYINSKMYDVTDDVNLQKIAYNMHLYNPNTMTWQEFLDSDNGKTFNSYLKDVQKYQQDKALDKIWNEDSNPVVDFMLPVSKAYARENYENIDGLGDMAGPLGFDLGANVVMMGAGKGLFAGKPTISGIYGNFAAPVITEVGNVSMNDKDVSKAAVGALEGGLVNAATPVILGRFGNWAERFQGPVSRTYSREAQEMVNKAADKAAEVSKRKSAGAVWREGDDWFKQVDGKKTKINMNKKEVGNDIISDSDVALAKEGEQFRRGVKKSQEAMETAAKRERLSERSNKWARIVAEKVARGETPSYAELQKAGMKSSESVTNFLGRLITEQPVLREYLTNAAGRPKFGQRGAGSMLNTLMPGIGLFKDEKEDLGSPKWYEYYGLSDWNK